MFAVYAQGFSQDDPLSGLGMGERPEPEVPDGWMRSRSRLPRSTITTCGACVASA